MEANNNNLDAVINKLQLLGYAYLGNLGISDREAFKARSGQVPYDSYSLSWLKHNLYVCFAYSDNLKNHIAFRDFLCENPGKAKAYGKWKPKKDWHWKMCMI
jgi:GrpB-like predicted nucleotidyltransferase (UPF0157 family)